MSFFLGGGGGGFRFSPSDSDFLGPNSDFLDFHSSKSGLIKVNLYPASLSNQYVKWGIEHEKVAVYEYIKLNPNCEVKMCGLVVNPKFLG